MEVLEDAKEVIISRFEDLYKLALRDGDLKSAVNILKNEAEILGIKENKVQIDEIRVNFE